MEFLKKDNQGRNANIKQRIFIVNEDAELMEFLIKSMPDNSRNSIKSLLAHKQVSVGEDDISQFNFKLKKGDRVIVNKIKKMPEKRLNGLKIIYEDGDLIVIHKDAGLLSIATETEKEKTAFSILTDYVRLAKQDNKIFILHRLDRETSGIMMFAKSKEVQDVLQNAWTEAVTERRYTVVVEGCVKEDDMTITSWLKENKGLVMYSSQVENDGQKATTYYKTIKKNKSYSMLEVKLETGRKNQIRVHMQDIGHPITGDKKYGAEKNPLQRLGLHARVLEFKHPRNHKIMRFETPIPKEFERLFEVKPIVKEEKPNKNIKK